MTSVSSNAIATLEELLVLPNEKFIEKAYLTILGRAPDKEGLVYYRERLKANVSKVEILAQLRNSKEGKSRKLNIAGLNDAVRRYKQFRTPLLGPLLRLAGVKQISIRPSAVKSAVKDSGDWQGLLNEFDLGADDLPAPLNLEIIRKQNPNEYFASIYDALACVLVKSPAQKVSLCNTAELNAKTYVSIALRQEARGSKTSASELYKLSLLFQGTSAAHEHLGNFAVEAGNYHEAISHYSIALRLNGKSIWIYLNLAHAQSMVGLHESAVRTIADALAFFPRAQSPLSKLDEHIAKYWSAEDSRLTAIASSQDRQTLIDEYEKITGFISDQYFRVFGGHAGQPLRVALNAKKVLVVGLEQQVLPQCFRYRMEQKLEQLKFAGYEAESILWSDYGKVFELINFYDLVVFYRVPAFPEILKLISYARSLGKITFYELDDLIFETLSIPPIESYGGQVSVDTYINLTKDIGYHRSAATKCDYAIASTLPLVERIAPLSLTGTGFLHRNGLDRYNVYAEPEGISKGYLNLFYGSATLAHNSDFIEEALPAISKILTEHQDVKLTLVGNLELPTHFLARFASQVVRVPLVRDIEAYWTYLAASDINLAVLHDDVLAGCKSELKWFEAATFSIPSVVSRTRNYLDVIEEGRDGFVVSGEYQWYSALKKLVQSPELRRSVGHRARARVMKEYSIAAMSENLGRIMSDAIKAHGETKRNALADAPNDVISEVSKKKKIAVVNIFYPPKALGGATRIVVDEVSTLVQKYGDEFEVVVFTADTEGSNHHAVTVYPHDGYRVYAVVVPLTVASNWHEKNPKIAQIFDDFLEFEKPDLVHFHCIQALTASILEVTQMRKIPNVVTLHDAWWISDHQFLMDQFGTVYPEGHPDPFEKSVLRDGTTLEQSLRRKRYLKGLLSAADGVFAVSETFSRIYRLNGVANTLTNKNGISNELDWQAKDTRYSDRVVCGHIGGMTEHKGFDVFKSAVTALTLSTLEVLVVDHTRDGSHVAFEKWGNTPVKIIGRVDQNHVVDLYKSIDVVFAPSTCAESFGLVTREAAACSCWVVGSNIGAIGEDISADNGFKVAPTAKELLAVLRTVGQQPEKYKKPSAAKSIRYSADQVGELIVSIRKIIDARPQHARLEAVA